VLIAYSVAGFPTKRFPDDTSISLNIVWSAVLASPEDPYASQYLFLVAFTYWFYWLQLGLVLFTGPKFFFMMIL
jgi:hypothetical protein